MSIKRGSVIAAMPAEVVPVLREYFRRSQEGMPQDEHTRAAMALYQKTRRLLSPAVVKRNREAVRSARARRTPAQVQAERERVNARNRAQYKAARGGKVRRYSRRRT